MLPSNRIRTGGFFKLPDSPMCRHPDHAFPGMLWIPEGHGYVHVCPACGHTSVVTKPVSECNEDWRKERQKFIEEWWRDLPAEKRKEFIQKSALGEIRPPWEE